MRINKLILQWKRIFFFVFSKNIHIYSLHICKELYPSPTGEFRKSHIKLNKRSMTYLNLFHVQRHLVFFCFFVEWHCSTTINRIKVEKLHWNYLWDINNWICSLNNGLGSIAVQFIWFRSTQSLPSHILSNLFVIFINFCLKNVVDAIRNLYTQLKMQNITKRLIWLICKCCDEWSCWK